MPTNDLYQNSTLDSVTTLSNSATIGTTAGESPSPMMKRLLKEKKVARDFQSRRQSDWTDIYDLYRDKVLTNRLTQRQAVNVPLLKETIKTLIAKTDDPPNVEWKELSGDADKQIIFQEIWNDEAKKRNFEGVDLQDKKTNFLYGRSFILLNWDGDGVSLDPLDIYDVVIDPLVKPYDVQTARFLIRQNIFRSLKEILADDRYDKNAKDKLKTFLSTKDGIVQTESNRKEWTKKNQRFRDMGVLEDKFPNFAAGDVIVNLNEHYTYEWNTKKEEFEKRVVVYADDVVPLLNETLMSLLGIDFWPIVTWAEDVETNDFWSDGTGDLVLPINKVANVWFSQTIENRTLKNFQMHWFDASKPGYIPQQYEPGPGRMLPAPGSPKDTIMPVDVSGLDDNQMAINFLVNIVEKATATTALDKGQQTSKKKQTKGEVMALLQGSNERVLAISKHYKRAWFEIAVKWEAIMSANMGKAKTLYKTSKSGKVWPKKVYPKDWKSEAGYMPTVRSSSEQENEKSKMIQRFQFVQQQSPMNAALKRVSLRRSLDILDLTPEELREIEDAELKLEQQQGQQGQQQQAQPQGQDQGMSQQIQQKTDQLKSLSQ